MLGVKQVVPMHWHVPVTTPDELALVEPMGVDAGAEAGETAVEYCWNAER